MFGHHVFFPLLKFRYGAIEAIMSQNKKELRECTPEFDDAFSEIKGNWSVFRFIDAEEINPLNGDVGNNFDYDDDLTYYGRYTVRFTFETLDEALLFRLKAP